MQRSAVEGHLQPALTGPMRGTTEPGTWVTSGVKVRQVQYGPRPTHLSAPTPWPSRRWPPGSPEAFGDEWLHRASNSGLVLLSYTVAANPKQGSPPVPE